MPRLVCSMPAHSPGRDATCGSVTKAPPSSGQPTICGKSASVHSSKSRMLPERLGNELIPTAAARHRVAMSACLKNSTGFDLNCTAVRVPASVSRNRNSMRSRVPNMLHAAWNLHPFTFSNRRAGPLLSNACLAISVICRYGSTSSWTRLSIPAFSRSSRACLKFMYMGNSRCR